MLLPDVIHTIRALLAEGDNPEAIMPIASALSLYMQKLQAEHNYAAVFPLELLPLPKPEMKKWGFQYAALLVRNTGALKRYQQDGALFYTRFQSMSPAQWEAIRSDAIDDLVGYNAEMRDKGSSTVPIPPEFKAIIDAYREEYNRDAEQLHSQLRDRKVIDNSPADISLYLPVLMQSSRIFAGLLLFLSFGVVQWLRHGGGRGILAGVFGETPAVENDYRLIVYGSVVGLVAIPLQVFYMYLARKGLRPFLLGILEFFPALGNLYLVAFLGYMILYRGLWSLADLRYGFSVVPILRLLFFTLIGWRSYKAFCHLHQMGLMLSAKHNEKLAAYIQRYRLSERAGGRRGQTHE